MLQYERITKHSNLIRRVTLIRREESVLVAIALFLFAGVILFNVFSNRSAEQGVIPTPTTPLATTTTTVSNTNPDISKETTSSVTNSDKVNINTAGVEELTTLFGIGESKAKAIIDYRNTYGLFPNVDSLTNVSGIGEKTLQKIRDNITV